jgi:4-amino-4-deoxy-L-arabinose transferase-like glycosyltransferase
MDLLIQTSAPVAGLSTPRRSTSLSLVIPAYNEQAVIAQAIDEALAALQEITATFEILVVDDGSTDCTAQIVASFAAEDPRVRLIRQPANLGYGAALRAGFEDARHDLIAFTDADCQFDLSDLDYLIELADRFDVVSGYRIDRKDSALRRFCSWGYNTLIQTLIGSPVRDIDCALKVFRRSALMEILPESTAFFANTEMFARAEQHGLRIVDVGVQHRPRPAGQSKVRLRDVPRTLSELLPYWWQIHFAGDAVECIPTAAARTVDKPLSDSRGGLYGLILMLLAGLVLFTNLDYPLIEPDEGRYAEIMREMAVTGDLLVPKLHHEAYLDKPPLFYWCGALSVALFGPDEWAVRLVPAAAAWLTIVVTFLCGRRLIGDRSAFLGALILTLSIGFTMCGRYLILDSMLTLFVTASLLIGILAIAPTSVAELARVQTSVVDEATRPTRSLRILRDSWLRPRQSIANSGIHLSSWMLAALCCGLGMLTKGPVAVLLVVPPLFAYAWLVRSELARRWQPWMLFAAVVLAVNLPWYVAMILYVPDFAHYFFWEHNVGRFLSGSNHPAPLWFYAPVLFLGWMPWGLLLFPLARFLASRTAEFRRQRPVAVGFLMLWAAWCLAFFSISSGKLPTYIVPCFPAIGLLLGHYLHCTHSPFAVGQHLDRVRDLFGQGTVYITCAGVIFAVVMWQLGLESLPAAAIHAGIWAVLAGLILATRHRLAPRLSWGIFCIVALATTWEASHRLVPAWAFNESIVRPDSELDAEMEDRSIAIACLEHAPGSIPFGLNRNDVAILHFDQPQEIAEFAAAARSGYLVVDESVEESQLRFVLPPDSALREISTGDNGTVFHLQRDATPVVARHTPLDHPDPVPPITPADPRTELVIQ